MRTDCVVFYSNVFISVIFFLPYWLQHLSSVIIHTLSVKINKLQIILANLPSLETQHRIIAKWRDHESSLTSPWSTMLIKRSHDQILKDNGELLHYTPKKWLFWFSRNMRHRGQMRPTVKKNFIRVVCSRFVYYWKYWRAREKEAALGKTTYHN